MIFALSGLTLTEVVLIFNKVIYGLEGVTGGRDTC